MVSIEFVFGFPGRRFVIFASEYMPCCFGSLPSSICEMYPNHLGLLFLTISSSFCSVFLLTSSFQIVSFQQIYSIRRWTCDVLLPAFAFLWQWQREATLPHRVNSAPRLQQLHLCPWMVRPCRSFVAISTPVQRTRPRERGQGLNTAAQGRWPKTTTTTSTMSVA